MKKTLLTATLTIGILGTLFTSSIASAASKTCDNDPATSGCTAPTYNGSWKKLSGGYSGDFRIMYEADVYGVGTWPYYLWDVNTGVESTSPVSMKYWAYLASNYATCPSADCYIDGGLAGTLNQDIALSGFNQFGSSSNYSTVHFKVEADVGGNTVADAVQASW